VFIFRWWTKFSDLMAQRSHKIHSCKTGFDHDLSFIRKLRPKSVKINANLSFILPISSDQMCEISTFEHFFQMIETRLFSEGWPQSSIAFIPVSYVVNEECKACLSFQIPLGVSL
jgi:hypothetical protein